MFNQKISYSMLFLFTLVSTLYATATASDLAPNKDYTPTEVVQIVIQALRDNDQTDAGIETVFRFASPTNKLNTGPLERFTGMIKRGFPDMLNHIASETDALEIRDGKALLPVWLTTANGQAVGYLFQLGKQTEGEYTGMWMTDAVYPLASRGQSI